jgi:hypothetical protein
MPPEHEAPSQAFYDHEQDEPRGRRRAVADWGVSEDVFDRMPSRRFVRRGEEPHERSRRDEDARRPAREDDPRGARRGEDARGLAREDDPRGARRGEDARGLARQDDPRGARRGEDVRGLARQDDPREVGRRNDARTPAREDDPRGLDEARQAPRFERDDEPRYDDWGADRLYEEERSVSRTIVIEREPELDAPVEDAPPALPTAPEGRRTVVIGGHPDRLPVRRNRPSRSAVERIGPRPDRIVAYAVALGVLLILIAILTSH